MTATDHLAFALGVLLGWTAAVPWWGWALAVHLPVAALAALAVVIVWLRRHPEAQAVPQRRKAWAMAAGLLWPILLAWALAATAWDAIAAGLERAARWAEVRTRRPR